jgi:AraC-like DNA-binding protein
MPSIKSAFFHLLCAGHFFCDRSYKVEREYFDSFLLMSIKSGKAYVEYEGKRTLAKAGDVVILDCKKHHSYGALDNLETLWIHFDGNISPDFFQMLYGRNGCVIGLKDDIIFLKTLSTIISNYEKDDPLPEVTISCHIHKLLAELLLSFSNKEAITSQDDVINDVIEFIKKSYSEKLTLNDLSKVACLSPYHLSRIFKERTGYSPYEYILMVRMNHAKHLLKSSDLQIKAIAFRTGFFSESNFTVSFKSQIGITPREFRQLSF